MVIKREPTLDCVASGQCQPKAFPTGLSPPQAQLISDVSLNTTYHITPLDKDLYAALLLEDNSPSFLQRGNTNANKATRGL